MRASRSEWEQFFQYVYAVRNALQKKVGGFFYIETIGFHVPHLHIRLVRRKNVTYKIWFDLSVATPDRALICRYAKDKEGWTSRYHCSIQETTDKYSALVHIGFAKPSDLGKQYGPSFANLSVSVIKPTQKTSNIYFNLTNWNKVPPHFKGSLTTYRKYVVQHELGHALFHIEQHEHAPPMPQSQAMGVCPVMNQQTLGTYTCVPGISNTSYTWNIPTTLSFASWLQDL